MPCEQVTIPGEQLEEASPLTIKNMNTQTTQNEVVVSYTVSNPNNFAVFGDVIETLQLEGSTSPDQTEGFTANLSANQSMDESVTFKTNLPPGSETGAEVCVKVKGTQRA